MDAEMGEWRGTVFRYRGRGNETDVSSEETSRGCRNGKVFVMTWDVSTRGAGDQFGNARSTFTLPAIPSTHGQCR